jgi:hypothetical protein
LWEHTLRLTRLGGFTQRPSWKKIQNEENPEGFKLASNGVQYPRTVFLYEKVKFHNSLKLEF